jgi:photosystem II stability/assembly factor-like uncharacterized protein
MIFASSTPPTSRRIGPILALTSLLSLTPLFAASRAATIFGLVDTGEIFVSTDQGESWTIRSTLPVRDAIALHAEATPVDLVLATRSGSVYRSSDAGFTWIPTGAIAVPDLVGLLVQADLSILVLTASGQVHRSTDHGTSFVQVSAISAPDCVSLTQMQPGQGLYVMTRTGEVFESSDDGNEWNAKGVISVPDAVSLAGTDLALHALTATGDAYESTDAGTTWIQIGTLSHVGTSSLVRGGSVWIASLRTGEVASSPDGVSWTWQGTIDQLVVTALAVDTPVASHVDPEPQAISTRSLWPNPASSAQGFTVAFRLPREASVALHLYDLAGRLVESRAPQRFAAGDHTFRWSPHATRVGLFVLRMESPNIASAQTKVVLVP